MSKFVLIAISLILVTGCRVTYLDDPIYNVKSTTTYPESMKDNVFVGIPTMTGDLVGGIITVPFLPIYYSLEDDYVDDEDAYFALHKTYGFFPRFFGRVFGSPFQYIKYAFYDLWFKPGS